MTVSSAEALQRRLNKIQEAQAHKVPLVILRRGIADEGGTHVMYKNKLILATPEVRKRFEDAGVELVDFLPLKRLAKPGTSETASGQARETPSSRDDARICPDKLPSEPYKSAEKPYKLSDSHG